jgi:LCP family protein required for cell wall assembly
MSAEQPPSQSSPTPIGPPSWFTRNRTLVVAALAGALVIAVAVIVVVTMAPNASALASPTSSPSATPIPTLEPTPTPTPQPTPTPNPYDQALLNHRYTVLVIGEDSDLKREARGKSSRTDTMMVVSLSRRQKHISMISLPRDTVDVPLANGLVFTAKANAIAGVYGYAGLRDAMATLLGVKIDAYLKVDMDNFAQLVDAVGGVKVTNTEFLNDGHLDLYLPPGTYRLDGATALDYVRSRYTTSDYARAARQQQVLLALVRRYLNPTIRWNLEGVLAMLDSLQTDIDLTDLPTLIEMARRSREADVTTMVLSPPRFALGWGDQGDGRGWIIVPNVDEIRAYARSVMGK